MLLFILLLAASLSPSAAAQSLPVPAEASEGLRLLYSGEANAAVSQFRRLQSDQPDNPMGYLLEANALWWKIYCSACERKWNTVDAWKAPKLAEHDAFFELARKGTALAEKQLAQKETAEMRLHAGFGLALEARLLALRDEKRATARAGVRAREHLLRAVELDPQLADAFTGLGLYNYFVDTLSPIVKLLRWLMGIPGGSKRDGMRQLETAIRSAQLTAVEARVYLAKSLRNYDQQYARAVALMEPLAEQYPRNAFFRLLLGDMHAKLGHHAEAAAEFRAAQQLAAGEMPYGSSCAARVRLIAQQALAALPKAK